MSDERDPLAAVDVDALEAGLVGMLAKAARGVPPTETAPGTSPDFSVVRDLRQIFEQVRDRRAALAHRTEMQRLADRPVQLAEYLGRYGETETGLAKFLNRAPTEPELEAFERGTRQRILEVRAIELERLRQGGGRVEPWMKG